MTDPAAETSPPARHSFRCGFDPSAARLRLGAGVTLLLIALWLGVGGGGPLAWLFIVVSVAVGLGWTAHGLRHGRRDERGWLHVDDWGVRLEPSGTEPKGEAVALAWDDVGGLELDEERVGLLLRRRDGASPLRLRAPFEGSTILDVAKVIEAHLPEEDPAAAAPLKEPSDGPVPTAPEVGA